MAEKLLESDFLTVDIQSLFNNNQIQDEAQATEDNAVGSNQEQDTLPTQYDWAAWGEELKHRLEANKSMSSEAQWTELEVETKFFKDFFMVNWGQTYVEPLESLGLLFKKALKVLGFNPKNEAGGNPILGFVCQDFAKRLLSSGQLNANTFKALYNAVAKKLVADSEFFAQNNYNIIYCEDLYKKSAAEMEKYLTLQSKILSVNVKQYTAALLTENKKIFLYIKDIAEQNNVKRAELIKNTTAVVDTVSGATLNNLELAEMLSGKVSSGKPLSDNEQNAISSKLDSTAKILAALLSLGISTGNPAVKTALDRPEFAKLGAREIMEATMAIASADILPKGQLSDDAVTELVVKLLKKLNTINGN